MNVKVITISDSLSKELPKDREFKDFSGSKLVNLFRESEILKNLNQIEKDIIPDDIELIQNALIESAKKFNIILTTGGTGLSPRDVTPEATKNVLERECPGIVTALLMRSLQATPMAALSRLTAGIINKSIVINLPGNPKAVAECFEVLEKILNHAIEILEDKAVQSTNLHNS